jgi:hypothetical protein
MLLTGRYKALKILRLCDEYHILGDATTGGTSVASRKTQIYQTGAYGVKNGKQYKVGLNFDVIQNGKAETECQSQIDALELDLGQDLVAQVSMLTCYSGHTDHANTADAANRMFGEEKMRRWDAVTAEVKAGMSPTAIKVASTYKKRHCGQHLVNIMSSNYIGARFTPKHECSNPDKHQMTHGKVEYVVLSRFCAADILWRHFDIARGRQAAQAQTNAAEASPRDVLHGVKFNWHLAGGNREFDNHDAFALKSWGFQRMKSHWHKCPRNKNPKPFDADFIPSVSGGMFAGSKLLSNRGDHSFYHLNESTIMEEWMRENGHVLLAVFLAFGGSRFNWHLTAGKAFLLNLVWLLTFMHTLMVCTTKPNRLVVAVFSFLRHVPFHTRLCFLSAFLSILLTWLLTLTTPPPPFFFLLLSVPFQTTATNTALPR